MILPLDVVATEHLLLLGRLLLTPLGEGRSVVDRSLGCSFLHSAGRAEIAHHTAAVHWKEMLIDTFIGVAKLTVANGFLRFYCNAKSGIDKNQHLLGLLIKFLT